MTKSQPPDWTQEPIRIGKPGRGKTTITIWPVATSTAGHFTRVVLDPRGIYTNRRIDRPEIDR